MDSDPATRAGMQYRPRREPLDSGTVREGRDLLAAGGVQDLVRAGRPDGLFRPESSVLPLLEGIDDPRLPPAERRLENLENLNSGQWEFNPALSPDGRYLVFTSLGRTENIGMGDLFVSWRNGPTWSVPVHLNPWANSPADDYHPSFSTDGQVLYFVRRQNPGRGGDIYAVPWSMVKP